MTRAEAIIKLKEQQQNRDTEDAHINADSILCELLESLGFHDVVTEFNSVEKWFA